MAESRQNRMKSSIWGRLALGMLVLSWVSASAQPCLMGMAMAADAPLMAEHSMHGQHGMDHAAGDDAAHGCGHCPPADDRSAAPCASLLSADCGVLPDYSVDGRGSNLKLDKDTVQFAVLPHVPIESVFTTVSPAPLCLDSGQLKYATGPALTIQYCVFLK